MLCYEREFLSLVKPFCSKSFSEVALFVYFNLQARRRTPRNVKTKGSLLLRLKGSVNGENLRNKWKLNFGTTWTMPSQTLRLVWSGGLHTRTERPRQKLELNLQMKYMYAEGFDPRQAGNIRLIGISFHIIKGCCRCFLFTKKVFYKRPSSLLNHASTFYE